MKIYIDLFFIFNLLMDAIILFSVSIILKRNTSIKRILLSSIVGAVSSLFLFTDISKLFAELVAVILMNLIAFKYHNLRYMLRNIFYTYILSVLLGGLIYLFNIRVSSNPFFTYLIILVISIEVMSLYIKEMKKKENINNNYAKVDIYFKDNEKITLVGFVDTGNNLYDPYQKRPIILVSKKYEREGKFLLVPYYTLSGDGILKCLRIEKILIDGCEYGKEVLVAFSDTPRLIEGGIDVILHKDVRKGK